MIHIPTNVTPIAARLRMLASCPESTLQAQKQGRRIAGVGAFGYGVVVPASFQDATSGVRAWSPPV